MSGKNTRTVKTMESQSGTSIGVFFPDLSTAQRLQLEAAANTQFPPMPPMPAEQVTEGGIWWISVPAGKTVLLINTPMSVDEAEDINLVLDRAWPIVGPIHYPIAYEAGDYSYLVPDGAGFPVHIVRNRNNGGAQ